MNQEPTNADLFALIENQNDVFLKHADDDHAVAEHQADVNQDQHAVNETVQGSLASLHEWKSTVATKEDVREIFAQELRAFFTGSGKRTKAILVGTAVIIGALTVIFGGLKSLLVWASYFLPK